MDTNNGHGLRDIHTDHLFEWENIFKLMKTTYGRKMKEFK